MSVADNIRSLATEARPHIRELENLRIVLAGFRDVASEKGISWTQLKALLIAEAKDEEDGGDRLKKLTEKFDLALTYADMLLNKNMAEEKNIPPQSSNADSSSKLSTAHPSEIPQTAASSPEDTTEPCSARGEPASFVSHPQHPADGAGSTNSVATRPQAGNGGAACERQFGAAPILSDEFNCIPAFLAREQASV